MTGSVAAVKTPLLASALRGAGMDVKLVPTGPALTFFDPVAIATGNGHRHSTARAPNGHGVSMDGLSVRGQTSVYLDEDEWPSGRLFEVGEPVLHIELRKWADLLIIAPLDANTLAKMAGGQCDNLLTCVYRAWDFTRPVILAPAMNTLMWEHPVTRQNLGQLQEYHGGGTARARSTSDEMTIQVNARCPHLWVVPPQEKRLACGDVGNGGMAEVEDIVRIAVEALAHRDDLPPRPIVRKAKRERAAGSW